MKKLMILVSLALIGLLPGDTFPRGPGGGRPAGGAPRPAGGGHPTPSFSAHPPPQHTANRPPANAGNHPGFVPNQGHSAGNRPTNAGMAQRPNQPNANRPNVNNPVVNRPNNNGGNQIVNRPNNNNGNQIVNRPNNNNGNQIVNRPNNNNGNQIVNRPNNNNGNQVFNRPNNNSGNQVFNRPINSGNTINNNSGNRNVNVNNQSNYQANFNRPGGYNYYHGNWAGWHHGYWNNWNYRPVAWAGAGLAGGWLLSGGETYVYNNPFYVSSPNVVVQGLDYAQPIAVPVAAAEPAAAADGEPAPEPEPPPVPEEATGDVDAARAAFKGGDYARAQALVEKAIAALPNDTTLHEFRALTLFAQQKYKDAAASIYAVLSAGPGWDWDTMRSFYPDVDTYTRQLRALEDYVKANPKYPEGHFLLAYHYLVLNQAAAAVKQLQQVAQLVPNDKLVPQLMKAFTPAGADRPAPQTP